MTSGVDINYYRLWVFKTVAESGGFSAAAERLFMSQPSVSTHVRRLEASLQVRLFDRSGAHIRLTEEGAVLLQYVTRLFVLADEAIRAVRQVSELEIGRLTIGGTTTVGTYLVPALLASLHRTYPGIAYDIVIGNAAQISRELVAGNLGLALVAGDLDATQLACEVILKERVLLVAHPHHPLVGRHLDPEDLRGERFLQRERGSGTRALQEATLLQWGLRDVATSEVWGPETCKHAAAEGLGITLVSEEAVSREIQLGLLAVLDVEPMPPVRPVALAYRKDRLLSPAERAFATLARAVSDWPRGDLDGNASILPS
ncbi:MAG: LysR family transcriptional regulator [Actinomycetota bacterium]|jgi:DNA-binding transcriptional LysR family regulator|nr:LysR family transcriptional regulator [Actinomycetota bacterium]